jgi:hypothetical protein
MAHLAFAPDGLMAEFGVSVLDQPRARARFWHAAV